MVTDAIVDSRIRALVVADLGCGERVQLPSHFVSVTSIVVDGYVGRVSMSVQLGDYVHYETYHLTGNPLQVDSVVARGRITVSRVPAP